MRARAIRKLSLKRLRLALKFRRRNSLFGHIRRASAMQTEDAMRTEAAVQSGMLYCAVRLAATCSSNGRTSFLYVMRKKMAHIAAEATSAIGKHHQTLFKFPVRDSR